MDKEGIINYEFYYDLLYHNYRYHAMGKNHGKQFVPFLLKQYRFHNLLDVGCSNGNTVKMFQDKGIDAYGVDVSGEAIRIATRKWGVVNCCRGTVLHLPYNSNFFDAVFSCDTLEHLHRKDITLAVREMIRVSRRWLFLHVSCKPEYNREFLDQARKDYPDLFKDIKNLHLTVYTQPEWIQQISVDKNVKLTATDPLLIFEKVTK